MTVTCATVRRAFGEFECCSASCHKESGGAAWPGLCCGALSILRKQCIVANATVTHPALLKALEEEANEPV